MERYVYVTCTRYVYVTCTCLAHTICTGMQAFTLGTVIVMMPLPALALQAGASQGEGREARSWRRCCGQ